ncbi:hypothetical protein C0995_009430 [Termitomyces sp. Mi166|nr:hypothetical protein C0995_009430 [Termitomyces sp. Mi166\
MLCCNVAKHNAHPSQQRLGNESMRRFDACALCLNRAREPLACGEGHLFCKECVYTDLCEFLLQMVGCSTLTLSVTQKKDIQTQKKKLEALTQEVEEEKARAKEAARERVLRDFEKGQSGLSALPSVTGTKSSGAADVDERECTVFLYDSNSIQSLTQARGTKRKFAFDSSAVENLAREAEEAALREIEREQAESLKNKLPDFWLPSLTPTYTSTGPPTSLKDVKLQTTCRGGNPSHPIALKHLVPVKFTYHDPNSGPPRSSTSTPTESEEKARKEDAEPMCPSCKKRLSNSILMFVMKPCAHVTCKTCTDSLVRPAKQCIVCDKELKEKDILELKREGKALRPFFPFSASDLILGLQEQDLQEEAWRKHRSSAAASPPHPQPESETSTHGLVIPSLTLPAALRKPTPYGQTLGDLRLLVLGSKDAGKSFMSRLLLEENDEVVEVGVWEDSEDGRVIRASTDWLEHRDAHGLETFEPTRNVEIVELSGYDSTSNSDDLIRTLKSIIQSPFYTVSNVLDPSRHPSPVLAGLVSSPFTPLYTALIFLSPSSPSVLDNLILDALGPQIPIIVLPRLADANRNAKISSFRPSSIVALRAGLFHSPETISVLRSEATDRFLRWREVERSVDDIHMSQRNDTAYYHRDPDGKPWSKAKWEAEWLPSLSQDVAKRLREGTVTNRSTRRRSKHHDHVRFDDSSRSCMSDTRYDPLYFPSLFMYSVSLLGPLRARMRRTLSRIAEVASDPHVRVAVLGGFCIGMGVGLFLKSKSG